MSLKCLTNQHILGKVITDIGYCCSVTICCKLVAWCYPIVVGLRYVHCVFMVLCFTCVSGPVPEQKKLGG